MERRGFFFNICDGRREENERIKGGYYLRAVLVSVDLFRTVVKKTLKSEF